jgi:hypothetical protein
LCSFHRFRPRGKKAMRCIMQAIWLTKHLTRSFPIRFWPAISFW